MKYVILAATHPDMGVEYAFPFVFSEKLVHSICADEFAKTIKQQTNMDSRVLSAGTCNVTRNGWACVRGSETLNIPHENEVNEEDARRIEFNDSMGVIF